MEEKVMTIDDFEKKYKLVKNHLDENASHDGCMFETFGENQPTKTVQYAPDHDTICFKHLYQIHLYSCTS